MNAKSIWNRLNANADAVIRRAETAAEFTVPDLFLQPGQSSDKGDGGRLWQSIGSQLVANLATRLMLALFAPSRPFVRLDPAQDLEQEADAVGATGEELRQMLSQAERKLVKTLDRLALRPKLFELLKHLIVIGNVMTIMDRESETLRVLSLRYFRVKRDVLGRVHTAIIKEEVLRDELPATLQPITGSDRDPTKVCYYVVIKRDYSTKKADRFLIEEWIDDVQLTGDDLAYRESYKEDECPFRVHTWALNDESDYGTSQVMAYEGDFAAVERVSAAQIVAAVLASEFRWLVNSAAGTRVEDIEHSDNGAFITGQKDAVTLVNAAGEVAQAMQAQQAVLQDYVQRLGRGFILTSALTRDAERVTAEEIRMLANELETGLGGGYSRLAVDVQRPMGLFLMAINDLKFNERQIELTVVTGLDALSRHGDLENLRGWLADIVQLQSAGEAVLRPLNLSVIYLDLASPRGIEASKYLNSPEQMKATDDEASARAVAEKQATQQGPSQ